MSSKKLEIYGVSLRGKGTLESGLARQSHYQFIMEPTVLDHPDLHNLPQATVDDALFHAAGVIARVVVAVNDGLHNFAYNECPCLIFPLSRQDDVRCGAEMPAVGALQVPPDTTMAEVFVPPKEVKAWKRRLPYLLGVATGAVVPAEGLTRDSLFGRDWR